MNKIVWKHLLSRRWTILRCDLFTRGYLEPLHDYIGIANKDLLVTKDKEKYSLYNSLGSLKDISQALIKKLERNENYGMQVYKDCLISCKKLVSISKKISKGNLNSLDPKELFGRLNTYFEVALDFTPFLAIPGNYEAYVTDEIKEFLIRKIGSEKAEKALQKLMTSKQHPYQVLEQIDLAKIARTIKEKRGGDIDRRLKQHKLKYQWLSCYNFDEVEFSLTDFKNRLDVLLELPIVELEARTKSVAAKLRLDELEFQKAIKQIDLSGELLNKVNLLREFVFLRTYRIEMNSQSNFYLKPLMAEIARRSNISLAKLAMMLPDEIKTMLLGNYIPKSVNFKERRETAISWLENYEYKYAFGKQAKNLISIQLGKVAQEKIINMIKGTTASHGDTVRGRVRILDKSDLNEFQKGEILVTIMTSPEFVPAMHKARAIVTDEGGVLCHAAIVSREMGKPCIIGTKIATKVLKNGDLVEVNTYKSIVRIIKGKNSITRSK